MKKTLKEMCCMFKGTHLSDVVETRSLHVKIMKELVPDDSSELIICQHVKKAIKIKLQIHSLYYMKFVVKDYKHSH